MPEYRWIVLFSALYAFIAFAFALQIVPPLANTIIATFGISNAQTGLLISAVVIPGIFLALPSGILTDRFGVRLTGSFSSVLIAAGSVITILAVSFEVFLVGRLIVGIGGAFILTSMPSIISQWFPSKELGKAMGIYGLSMPLASVAAFLSASFLILSYDWHYPLYLSTALAILNVFTFSLVVKEGPLRQSGTGTRRLRKGLTNMEVWKTGIIWMLFNAAVISFTTWASSLFQIFWKTDPFYGSFLASAIMLSQIPCSPLFGWVSDRIDKRKPLILWGSLLIAGFFIVTAISPIMVLPVSVLLLGVVAALVPPIVNASAAEASGPQSVGISFGIMSICLNSGIALAPPLIGYAIDLSNSMWPSFLGMSFFSILAAIIAYTLKTR